MDLSDLPDDDVLSTPTPARLLAALAGLRRPASTDELARLVRRHPNTVRLQLQRLANEGLIECRLELQDRGRPKHAWAIEPGGRPGGSAPQAHANLSRWLARATGHDGPALAGVQTAGREIGRELAPGSRPDDPGGQAMQDALSALGFSPRNEPLAGGKRRYVLRNCPYREAVAENAAAVCTLHRGITEGLLERLDPKHRLTAFVPKDPVTAGCLIEVGAA